MMDLTSVTCWSSWTPGLGLSISLPDIFLLKMLTIYGYCFLAKMPYYTFVSQKVDDIENEANKLKRIKNYLHGKLSEHTSHPIEKVRIVHCMLMLMTALAQP